MSDLLTTQQVAEVLHVNIETVHRHLRTGRLRGFRPSKRWLVRPEDLDAYIANAQNIAPVERRRRRA